MAWGKGSLPSSTPQTTCPNSGDSAFFLLNQLETQKYSALPQDFFFLTQPLQYYFFLSSFIELPRKKEPSICHKSQEQNSVLPCSPLAFPRSRTEAGSYRPDSRPPFPTLHSVASCW